ncbi:MAG: glycosyltransferase family 2 protein [Chloroflexi bacterium]|nr:glycosyltransferase family 2 protein [Chloroflexota bacterium]MCL5075617.1 glycosyltransferase family 2 protein [Chloroflexota bacterium]
MSEKVTVIVVNWNGRDYLETCLSSVLRQSYPNFEILLIDNASTDGSLDLIEERFPQVGVIRNRVNLGFAAANNIGIQQSSSDYIATLNNDTKAEETWLAELVKAARTGPDIGMCASKMLFMHQPAIINSAGIALDRAGIAWDNRGGEEDTPDDSKPYEVFGPCAGAALYRREMLMGIGLFDEDFFAYLEDVDLAWRARLAGWRCLYVPTAKVYHIHSATAREGSSLKTYLLGRNKIWTIIKNYPSPHFWLFWPIIVGYDFGSVLFALFSRRDIRPLQGRLSALTRFAPMWRKRRVVQRNRKISPTAMWHLMYPLERPDRVFKRYGHLRGYEKPEGDGR